MIIFGAVDFTAALGDGRARCSATASPCATRAPCSRPAQRFPMADEVVNDWPDRYLEKVGDRLGPRDAVCVLTHDAKFDVPAIVGALGDRRRLPRRDGLAAHARPTRVERLREAGRRPTTGSTASMAPIGLDIGARTPEETAIVDLRRDHRRPHRARRAARSATARADPPTGTG